MNSTYNWIELTVYDMIRYKNDNAFQRNMEAVKFIDKITKDSLETDYETLNEYIGTIREILTCYKGTNILEEVNTPLDKKKK